LEDLQLAAKVHYSFLPTDYQDNRVSIAVTLRPLRPIGGDYCSILPLDEDLILLCICDAVGHGTSAALFAARINTYILTHAKAELSPCELVAGLNSYLCKRLAGVGMYTTFYAVLLDFKQGVMSLAGAAHPPVLQFDKKQNICRNWPSIVSFLGMMDPIPITCGIEQAKMSSGDRILIYSDGLIEAEAADQQLWGLDRLSVTLLEKRAMHGQVLNKAILAEAESFAANGFQDDVLLMSVSLK
jgi:serine phosphatase RsbU (regulator of sigma subunit)